MNSNNMKQLSLGSYSTVIIISGHSWTHIVHFHTDVVGVDLHGPLLVIQQIYFLGTSAGPVITDLICCSIGVD